MAHTLCTFNVNNLFVRYRFGQVFPGDISGKSQVPQVEQAFGYLPLNNPGSFVIFNPQMRDLAAKAIRRGGSGAGALPDILCLQEVESLTALRTFNDRHLGKAYKYAIVIDSRDLRQIDVAILSKLELANIRSHVDDTVSGSGGSEKYLFSRDCLEVDVLLNKSGSKRLTLFINHLKSKLAFSAAERAKADARRKLQGKAVADIARARFSGAAFNQALFAVVGDMNDEPLSPPLADLVGGSGLINVLDRIATPQDRWTHWYGSQNSVSQLDYLLLSPELDKQTKNNLPQVERRGIGFANFLADGKPGPRKSRYHARDGDPNPIDIDFRFARFSEVTPDLVASDHCPVFLDIP